MHKKNIYSTIIEKSLSGEPFDQKVCVDILASKDFKLLKLLDAAFEIREKFWGREVRLHILNNVQNGLCPEDCSYCAQSKRSTAPIEQYPMKSDDEILTEAKQAYESGAFRYCMVLSGNGPTQKHVDRLVKLVKVIKKQYPLEVCVSPGVIDEKGMKELKNAGLDRINHNLNTSKDNYPKICTTHTYDDRVHTLKSAHKQGLQICSGIIVGMGESHEDIVELALQLKAFKVDSMPINFLIPIEGTSIDAPKHLTPEYCLRVLCLFRFLNPSTEIRIAAGREYHLRDMEVMALYPANSLFLSGYLNVKGSTSSKTLRMIKDAGFTINSEIPLDDLLSKKNVYLESANQIKNLNDLRPNK